MKLKKKCNLSLCLAFPNDTSLLRLAGSILIDINEEWINGNRYLSVKIEMISLDTVAADYTAT